MVAQFKTSERITWARTNRRNPCPICNSYGYCEISHDGKIAHCMRVESSKPGLNRLGGWYHELGMPLTVVPALTPLARALSPDKLDRIFRYFMACCPLSEKHREYLKREGVNPTGCGSLSQARAGRLAKELIELYGEDAKQHPLLLEVTRENGRNYWAIASAADGIIFPAINIDGLILGAQIRKDLPKGKDDRYRWLSSAGRGGTPLTVFKAAPDSQNKHMVIVTEGYKKAAAVSQHFQCHAISIAGVSAYDPDEILRTCRKLGVSVITIAFDADKCTKSGVQKAEKTLLKLLAAKLPGLPLYTLNWDGEAKGIDDAIKMGAIFDYKHAMPGLVTGILADFLGANLPKPKKLFTLAEARAAHKTEVRKIVTNPQGQQIIITSPTGTGKSTAADDETAIAALNGTQRGRVLILAPNKANIAERTAKGTELRKAINAGFAVIQQGRNLIDLQNPLKKRTPFDCANPQAREAGENRQITAKVVCSDCPFGSAKNWEKAFPNQPRPFMCELEGYVASKLGSKDAPIVIATKESYLNNSKEIKDFDTIICDEDMLPYLYEVIWIDSGVLSTWREKIALTGLSVPAWTALIRIIETAFEILATRLDKPKVEYLTPAIEVLEEAAARLGEHLPTLLRECSFTAQNKDGAYEFETVYTHGGKKRLPFRAGEELLEALKNKDNPVYYARNTDNTYRLVIHIARRQLANILRSKSLIVLDATVPPTLKAYLPNLKEVRYSVPQNLHITQVTDGLYTKRDLHNPQVREKVSAAMNQWHNGSPKALTVMPLRFEDGEAALKVIGETIHWGEHRATNQYSDCTSLTLIGHMVRPIDQIAAEVRCARDYAGEHAPANTNEKKLRLYNYRTKDGNGAGRWMSSDIDPDVQAAIEADYSANIIQAVGRLRAALRLDESPIQVLILCNEPVNGLEVQELATISEVLSSKRTYPPKNDNSIYESLNGVPKKQGVGSLFTLVDKGLAELDPWLIQDETRETQDFDPIELESIWGTLEILE